MVLAINMPKHKPYDFPELKGSYQLNNQITPTQTAHHVQKMHIS